ncbi:hypothetical protein HPP92_016606 [Vanilla planifolia]|uniref:GTP diphosphokinase n=1 Tax=Vanilla planifolia TaxID=51239 RepID=A0A835QFI7_VANPL|nr:hypothetical protein HPP92_016606 [Vanilla planifolia]
MSVPAIALYNTPPSGLCSALLNSCQITCSHGFPECDFNPRSSSSTAATSTYGHKPVIVGGLSCLFSSPPFRFSPSAVSSGFASEELRHSRVEDVSSSFSFSSSCSSSSSFKCRDPSPVSVFHGPISCSASSGISASSQRGLPSLRIPGEWNIGDLRSGRDGLLNGVVRNALGSCLDYNSPKFSFPNSGNFGDEDLTFNFEGSLSNVLPSCDPYARDFIFGAQSRHKIFHEEIVVKAFYESWKAHRGQVRASGDPYLQHCVETAVLLSNIGANSTIVAAGLLHDTTDDSFMDYDYILKNFGAGVAYLVEEVSKLSYLSKLARENNTANRLVEANRLHTIFLAMVDARAILIKLADRLHNMMTLEFLSTFKRQRFAKETLEIFVPLANRLGISSWKERLENLCFKHLHPKEHEELSCKLCLCFDEAKISSSIQKLDQALSNEGFSHHVISGRHKSLFSIYSKMIKKRLTMEEIHDIYGLRLIVEKEEDCYKALSIVHHLWPEVLGRLKDYIVHPKCNGYRSLHTVVMSDDKRPLEVQIRTKEMHLQAEYGFAAHWRYKEGVCQYSSFVLQMVEWARWVVTCQCEKIDVEKPSSFGDPCSSDHPFPSHSAHCRYSYTQTHHCDHDGPIFIIMLETEKMSVQELPPNTTIMDMMERSGRVNLQDKQPYSFPMKEELRPRVNRQPVSDPNLKLRLGDVVELTPAIPDKSLIEYREEIKRMYDHGLAISAPGSHRS